MSAATPGFDPTVWSDAVPPGWRVEVVATAPSTNSLLAERFRGGERGVVVLVAGHQTAGRGRLSRVWETPAGTALTLSVLLEPQVPAARWPGISLLAGVAVADALRDLGVAATLKWPNDVLVGERKVGGILVERVEDGERAAAVVGIGLNVSMRREELPVGEATSLAVEGGPTDRSVVLAVLLRHLARRYDAWGAAAGDLRPTLLADYRERCSTLGRQVRVLLPRDAVLEGTAAEVDAEGRLVVVTPASAGRPEHRHVLGVGDVVHVRPGAPS